MLILSMLDLALKTATLHRSNTTDGHPADRVDIAEVRMFMRCIVYMCAIEKIRMSGVSVKDKIPVLIVLYGGDDIGHRPKLTTDDEKE